MANTVNPIVIGAKKFICEAKLAPKLLSNPKATITKTADAINSLAKLILLLPSCVGEVECAPNTTSLSFSLMWFQYIIFTRTCPNNAPNINNLLKLGFKVIAQKPIFSELLLRNILFLDLHA